MLWVGSMVVGSKVGGGGDKSDVGGGGWMITARRQ
jgi:hypothetical protein